MNNENQSLDVKTKNITLGSIIGWIVGVLSVLTGVMFIFSKPLIGIIYLLIACLSLPPLNRYIQSKLNIKLSKGVKIILVLILLGIAGTLFGSSNPAINTAIKSDDAKTSTPPAEIIKVTALKIYSDYKDNEVSADAKYKGKTISVSGQIGTIGKDITDTPYVSLNTEQYSIGVIQCMFSQKDLAELGGLSKGQQVTLQGEVSGKLGNVLVRGCQVVK